MKTDTSTRQSMAARFVHLRAATAAITRILDRAVAADAIPDESMGKLRRLVAEAAQCFHEMNAYRNVVVTK